MVFSNEFDRLRNKILQSKQEQEDSGEATRESSATPLAPEDEQIFNSSIKELWQQAVEDHQRNLDVSRSGKEEETENEPLESSDINWEEQQREIEEIYEATKHSISPQIEAEKPVLQAPQELGLQPAAPSLDEKDKIEHSAIEEIAVTTVETEVAGTEPDFILSSPDVSNEQGGIQAGAADSVHFPLEMLVIEEDEGPVENFHQISLKGLQEEVNETLERVYEYYQSRMQEIFGFEIPSKDNVVLTQTKLGEYANAIVEVARQQGRVTREAMEAVRVLLPILWKPLNRQEYSVSETWYGTNLGFICRFIQSGQSCQSFDPIDLSTAASMLHCTEQEVIDLYPKLGGVKLGSSYIFSKQLVEEFASEFKGTIKPASVTDMEHFYENAKESLSTLLYIEHEINYAYDEIRYIRDLLLSGIDFLTNRIKQPVKILIEQRLGELYRKYKQLSACSLASIEVNRDVWTQYELPNIFAIIEQYSGEKMTGDRLAESLEQTIKLIDQERATISELSKQVTGTLGQLSVDMELLKIKQGL
ncbi:hypothetical protein [Ammoniphilus resinae]|uniref:Uncharacterized protein n=1 Tax=Ammoniphilus resinae TaxID=861532 RepID=A0ABS4GMW0_9BACL|nr:hypothetical protein [Ammoniphilus resinae]MBP1931622.1 hypothetical protein [Ammoniphilus resinae]